MLITCINQDRIESFLLPAKISGQYWMGDLVSAEAENGRWYLRSNGRASLTDTDGRCQREALLVPARFYTLMTPEKRMIYLYTEELTADRMQYRKYLTVNQCVLRIGRSDQNDIVYSSSYVSGVHAQIEVENGYYIISDMRSGNGTFVNNKRIVKQRLLPGDIIYISGLKIAVGNGILAVNNPDGKVICREKYLIPYKRMWAADAGRGQEMGGMAQSVQEPLFYKSPRFRRDVEKVKITIDSPPAIQKGNEVPVIYAIGPSMTMGMASMFMAVFAVSNAISGGGGIESALPSVVMAASMLGGSVAWPLLSRSHEKKKKFQEEAERKEKYRQYLMGVRGQLQQIEFHQRKILLENYVTLDECITRIAGRKRSLWERSFDHVDFLTVRLGRGEVPLLAELEYQQPKFEVEEDELRQEMEALVSENRILGDVPVGLSLYEHYLTGIIGRRQDECSFIKGLIFQIAALHSYDELKMVFLYNAKEEEQWHFVKWLPHVWSDNREVRFIATEPGEQKEVSVYLEKQLAARLEAEEEEECLPYYLIFSMDKELADNMEIISQVLKQKSRKGFGLVALYDQMSSLPKECTTVLEVGGELGRMYRQDDISGDYMNFCPDGFTEPDCGRLAVSLANIHLYRDNRDKKLPDLIGFLEMFRAGKVEHLNALSRWKENDPTVTLETEIGVDASGNPFKLDLHEKFHGPHGLVAGMTGSGKSEFIMTYILSLAVNYHPYEVAFILIDYKGGGMAKAFENLPHTAGIITNLDGAEVNRSLISINSELKRRQAVFGQVSKQVNVSNIDIYKYQKLYRDGVVSEPMQHLFIISDEFAELKQQQPEFMKELISAARIGRSLGVHLILATQKPAGVVDDQIWSNSRFRICLKVQEKADSMDMLKRPDAAWLTKTGRFYLQVGYNEIFEMGQSAWSGASYIPQDRLEEKKDRTVQVIDRTGRILKQKAPEEKRAAASADKQLDAITKYLSGLAKEEHIKVKPLWLPPLSETLTIEELREKYALNQESYSPDHTLAPLIGEVDDPQNQAQYPMRLPLSEEGNLILYGAAGSGKTLFLTALLASLMEEHAPDEVNFYILDFGSEVLRAFQEAPHVGDVVLISEKEKVVNLFGMLETELEARKKLCAVYGGDFRSYLKSGQEKRPNLVLIIQNFAAFTEVYEDYLHDAAQLAADGSKYGIYLIITAANASGVRYRVSQNFPSVYAMQLNDETDYAVILGNVGGQYPAKVTGRGIFKRDKVYEFQTARYFGEESGAEPIRSFCGSLSAKWPDGTFKYAAPIPVLPEKVTAEFLKDFVQKKEKSKGAVPQETKRENTAWDYPVGVAKNSLRIKYFDLSPHFVNLITYQDESCSFVEEFCRTAAYGPARVIVLNAKPGFESEDALNARMSAEAEESGRYEYYAGEAALAEGAQRVYQELLKRNNDTKDAWEQGKTGCVYPGLLCIINGYRDFKKAISEEMLDKWNIMLDRIEEFWNCRFVIAESIQNLSSVTAEAWFSGEASRNDGIYVGNGLTDQYELMVTRVTRELHQEIPDDFGYVVAKGRAVLVKLVTAEEEE